MGGARARRRSALIYALAFIAVYAALVGPLAVRERLLVEAIEDVVVLVVVAEGHPLAARGRSRDRPLR